MYADPSLIREHVVKIRLNSAEEALVNALVNYTGQQKATLLREILLEQASVVLGMNSASSARGAEVPQLARQGL